MESRTPPSEALAAWLPRQRWFASKTRRVETVTIEDALEVGGAALFIVGVALDDGTHDRYAVPLCPADSVADAFDDPQFGRALLAVVAAGARLPGSHGELRGVPTSAFPAGWPTDVPGRRLGSEQSNTSLAFGTRLILKHFRRLADGRNPEEEMTRFLTERARFPHTPRLAGHLEYRRPDGVMTTLAVVQELVPEAHDGWQWTLAALEALYAGARGAGPGPTPERVRALAAPTLAVLARLGMVTAGLHHALASDASDPAFAPEPVTPLDVAAWADAVRAQLAAARAALGPQAPVVDLDVRSALDVLVSRLKIRHHGDLHLGQTLHRETTGDVMIIDFEGEPLRPLAERRRKHTPLRDVAGVLRSIDYVAVASQRPGLEPWAAAWAAEAAAAFTTAYRATAGEARFLPPSDGAFQQAVAVFELEKAAYEVVYEANHRPDWIGIPRRGLLRAAARLAPASGAAAE
jgi:maltose alpha-D-glucosyltransferase/alpha-amylase